MTIIGLAGAYSEQANSRIRHFHEQRRGVEPYDAFMNQSEFLYIIIF